MLHGGGAALHFEWIFMDIVDRDRRFKKTRRTEKGSLEVYVQ